MPAWHQRACMPGQVKQTFFTNHPFSPSLSLLALLSLPSFSLLPSHLPTCLSFHGTGWWMAGWQARTTIALRALLLLTHLLPRLTALPPPCIFERLLVRMYLSYISYRFFRSTKFNRLCFLRILRYFYTHILLRGRQDRHIFCVFVVAGCVARAGAAGGRTA